MGIGLFQVKVFWVPSWTCKTKQSNGLLVPALKQEQKQLSRQVVWILDQAFLLLVRRVFSWDCLLFSTWPTEQQIRKRSQWKQGCGFFALQSPFHTQSKLPNHPWKKGLDQSLVYQAYEKKEPLIGCWRGKATNPVGPYVPLSRAAAFKGLIGLAARILEGRISKAALIPVLGALCTTSNEHTKHNKLAQRWLVECSACMQTRERNMTFIHS